MHGRRASKKQQADGCSPHQAGAQAVRLRAERSNKMEELCAGPWRRSQNKLGRRGGGSVLMMIIALRLSHAQEPAPNLQGGGGLRTICSF